MSASERPVEFGDRIAVVVHEAMFDGLKLARTVPGGIDF
jgi:hypothetical protein